MFAYSANPYVPISPYTHHRSTLHIRTSSSVITLTLLVIISLSFCSNTFFSIYLFRIAIFYPNFITLSSMSCAHKTHLFNSLMYLAFLLPFPPLPCRCDVCFMGTISISYYFSNVMLRLMRSEYTQKGYK